MTDAGPELLDLDPRRLEELARELVGRPFGFSAFDVLRRTQRQVIGEALAALRSRRWVLLEAPTGTGKSLIALALAALRGETRVEVFVSTRQLQAQYLRDFALDSVMGWANYPCFFTPDRVAPADGAPCRVGVPCDYDPRLLADPLAGFLCPARSAYLRYGARDGWFVTNYAYGLRAMKARRRPGFTVFDEAHDLEGHVRDLIGFRVAQRQVRQAGLKAPPESHEAFGPVLQVAFSELAGRYQELTQRIGELKPLAAEGDVRATEALGQLIRERDRVRQALESLGAYRDQPQHFYFEPDRYGGVEVRPVIAAPWTDFVFYGRWGLLMSATILDPDFFAESIGLKDYAFVEVAEGFDPARRPIYFNPAGRVSRGRTDWDALVQKVDLILSKRPSSRGLIHTGNYEVAQVILERSAHRDRLIGHGPSALDGALQELRRRRNGVLVSPAATTGVDLPYEMCRFIIIAKLPFPNLADRYVAARLRLAGGEKWYSWVTMVRLIQACGRGMRAEDDFCETVILDGNWSWFRRSVRLPAWFARALR